MIVVAALEAPAVVASLDDIAVVGYAGMSYPSLTKIANKITGTHWSGPRFFGLTAPATERPVNRGQNG